jgi:hypothetical protein
MEGNGPLKRRFVVDSMLGKVAKWLRILGYDTRCEPLDESKLIEYSEAGWLLLTRRQSWCGRRSVVCLHQNAPMDQIRELHGRVHLEMEAGGFLRRCIRCNELLEGIERRDVIGQVPDYTFETVTEFNRCPTCGRIYWEGSHRARITERLKRLLGEEPPETLAEAE